MYDHWLGSNVWSIYGAPNNLDFTVIDLFNSAGYKCSWLSNQPAWGLGGYESSTTFLALKCQNMYFVHKETPELKFDEALIPPIKKLLENEEDQILFVHLQGSHIAFHQRYPKDFEGFVGCEDDIYRNIKIEKNKQITNEYDSSIKYTDYVLNEIIKLLEKKQSPTFLFYVSDHSECADIDDFTKRRSLVSQERACYEIPFLLWYSPEYADINSDLINSGKKNLTAPLQCDLALWSICDMAGISWDKFPVEKSIFSEEYIPPKKRFIYQAEY